MERNLTWSWSLMPQTSAKTLTDYVLTAIRHQSRSRVFVTISELPEIQRRSDFCSRLRLDDPGEQMDHGIDSYFQDRLTCKRLQRLSAHLRDDAFDSLRGQSAGMSKGVRCQLDTISSMNSCTRRRPPRPFRRGKAALERRSGREQGRLQRLGRISYYFDKGRSRSDR